MNDYDTYLSANTFEVEQVLETVPYNPPPSQMVNGFPVVTDQRIIQDRIPSLFDKQLSSGSRDATYTSYAGVDIVAEIVLPNEDPLVLGELQTISYSMHRENTPVRFIGHVNPAGFVKGPRTIAGSLIFTVFNYYAFYRLKQFRTAMANNLYCVADMLPPFDIVITFANELGTLSKQKIYGVTIIDEGGTMSVDDLITEQTYSYMARGIQPMTGYYIEDSVASAAVVTDPTPGVTKFPGSAFYPQARV